LVSLGPGGVRPGAAFAAAPRRAAALPSPEFAMQSQPSERAAVVATIDPANYNNSTQNTDYVDMSKFHEAMFVVLAGSLDSTVDFKLREARDTGGTAEQDITGKVITQFQAANHNQVAVINLKSEETTATPSLFRYVRGRLTVGNGTTNIVAVVAFGMRPRVGPASDDKLGKVAQIVT
jgi:hypothetical protein